MTLDTRRQQPSEQDSKHRCVPRPSRMKWYGQERIDGLVDWQGYEPTAGWEASQS